MQTRNSIGEINVTYQELKEFIKNDIYRNTGEYNKGLILRASWGFADNLSFLYYFRKCQYYSSMKARGAWTYLSHAICYLRFKRLQQKCGIELNQHTKIGYGLRLPHKGGIVIHPGTVIGNNCEIMQGVTIGNNILKDRDAVAIIGDNVLICAGAKIIGAVEIGNNVVIGANAVVTKDVPDNTIMAGVPAIPIGTCNERFVINRLD